MKKKSTATVLFVIFVLTNISPIHAQHWQSVGNGMSHTVRDMYSDTINNMLYIGGNFEYADTIRVKGICNWNGTNWGHYDTTDLKCGFGMCEPIYSLCHYHNDLFVSGAFGFYGIDRKFLKKWDGVSWQECGNPNTAVNLQIANDSLFALGNYDTISNKPLSCISKWNGTEWVIFGDTASIDFFGATTCCVAYYKGSYYFGGNFNLGNNMNEIMRWDGTQWLPLQNGILGQSWVGSMVVYNDELYVGGLFTKANGNAGNYIAKWDGSNWHDVGGGTWGSSGSLWDGMVNELIVHKGYLYAIGFFSYAGGIFADKIARWDGTNWCGFGDTIDNPIDRIGIVNDEIYIGGGYQVINGDTINFIAKWTGGAYTDTCGNMTGVQEVAANADHISLYPNPASDYVNIDYNIASEGGIEICIYNYQGVKSLYIALSQNKGNYKLNTAMLAKGLYLISITSRGRLITSDKLIIIK